MPTTDFWLNNALVYGVLYLISYGNGVWVKRKGIKVNYTRKINHFALFLSTPIAYELIPYERNATNLVWGVVLTFAALAVYAYPIRRRIPVIATMFLSFDRPEDRPYTLLWLITQFIASYLVLIPLGYYLYSIDRGYLLLIPILINGLGDGLAEPIGVRFGKHRYQTRALFSQRTYTRSLEGSACVFVSAVLAILLFADQFSQLQLVIALTLIPPIMTLTEAISPHTWDSPFLYLIGGLLVIGVDLLPKIVAL